jgi:hypothetical protein
MLQLGANCPASVPTRVTAADRGTSNPTVALQHTDHAQDMQQCCVLGAHDMTSNVPLVNHSNAECYIKAHHALH